MQGFRGSETELNAPLPEAALGTVKAQYCNTSDRGQYSPFKLLADKLVPHLSVLLFQATAGSYI